MATVAVLGAGSWGSALAIHLQRIGQQVRLWARNPETIARLEREHLHRSHPAVEFPSAIGLTHELERACADADAIVVACPSHAVRSLVSALADMNGRPLFISTAKGIEANTHLTMSGVHEEVLPQELSRRVVVLSGPSFAREVGLGMPTAVTAAARDLNIA